MINTAATKDAARPHYGRLGPGRRSHPVQGVGSDIHQRAAAKVALVADLGSVIDEVGLEQGGQVAHLSQLAGADDLQHPGEQWVVAIVEGLHQHPAARLRRRDHGASLAGVHRKGLLAQHMLARLERGDGEVGVPRGRQGVVDRIDVGPGDQVLIGLRHLGNAVQLGEGARPGRISGGDGHHGGDPRRLGRQDHGAGRDLGRPEDADAQRRLLARHQLVPRLGASTRRVHCFSRWGDSYRGPIESIQFPNHVH